jgi:hypothetical protein
MFFSIFILSNLLYCCIYGYVSSVPAVYSFYFPHPLSFGSLSHIPFPSFPHSHNLHLRYADFVLQLPAYLPAYHASEPCGKAPAEFSITFLLVNLPPRTLYFKASPAGAWR